MKGKAESGKRKAERESAGEKAFSLSEFRIPLFSVGAAYVALGPVERGVVR